MFSKYILTFNAKTNIQNIIKINDIIPIKHLENAIFIKDK